MALGKALDYSQARPPLGKVKANGYSCVYRYVCSDTAEAGLPGKRLTPAERDQILHAGLDIGLHGEDNAGAAQGGYPRGKQQGTQWGDYAHDVLDAPTGMTIVAAIDYDTGGTYPQVVADYLHGVADGLAPDYKVGVYGSIYVVDAALAQGHAVHGVQTVAWSHGKVSSWAHLYQHGSTEFQGTDYNDILRVPHGSWLQTLGGGMSVNGPEHWDKADFDALASALVARITALMGYDTSNPDKPSVATACHYLLGLRDGDPGHNDLGDVRNDITKLSQQVAAIPSPGAPVNYTITGVLDPVTP